MCEHQWIGSWNAMTRKTVTGHYGGVLEHCIKCDAACERDKDGKIIVFSTDGELPYGKSELSKRPVEL